MIFHPIQPLVIQYITKDLKKIGTNTFNLMQLRSLRYQNIFLKRNWDIKIWKQKPMIEDLWQA